MNLVAGETVKHRAPDWDDAGNCRALQTPKGCIGRRANWKNKRGIHRKEYKRAGWLHVKQGQSHLSGQALQLNRAVCPIFSSSNLFLTLYSHSLSCVCAAMQARDLGRDVGCTEGPNWYSKNQQMCVFVNPDSAACVPVLVTSLHYEPERRNGFWLPMSVLHESC